MEADMRFDAVIFDLDGTLTESGQGISRSAAYAIEKMGFAPLTEAQLLEFVGPPLYDSFIRLCGMTSEQSYRAIELYRERHWKIGWMEAPVYEGIFELLFTLIVIDVVVLYAAYFSCLEQAHGNNPLSDGSGTALRLDFFNFSSLFFPRQYKMSYWLSGLRWLNQAKDGSFILSSGICSIG